MLLAQFIGEKLAAYHLKKIDQKGRPPIIISPPPPSWITEEIEIRTWHNAYAYGRCLGYTADQSAEDATEVIRRRRAQPKS